MLQRTAKLRAQTTHEMKKTMSSFVASMPKTDTERTTNLADRTRDTIEDIEHDSAEAKIDHSPPDDKDIIAMFFDTSPPVESPVNTDEIPTAPTDAPIRNTAISKLGDLI